MLFYIAAQNKTSDLEASSGMKWVMPSLYVNNVVAFLNNTEDQILVHYAAKTIENIAIQAGGTYVHLFNNKVSVIATVPGKYRLNLVCLSITQATVSQLLHLAYESDRVQLQATCASALMHILRHSTFSEDNTTCTNSKDTEAFV